MSKRFIKTFFTLFLLSCSFLTLHAKESLVGVLENGPDTRKVSLYFAMSGSQQDPLEVSEVDSEGNFTFHYRPKSIGYFTLQFENAKSVLCVLRPGQTVYLTIDARTGMLLKTFNSDENTLLLSYQQQLIALDRQKDSILKNHIKKENPDFQKVMAQLEADRKAAIVRLCESNVSNYGSAALLEFLDVDEYQETYAKVLETLRKKYRKNVFLERKWSQLQTSLQLNPGNPAPMFVLPDSEGKDFSLESLKGKVVLLDFWASWCPDCRRANPYIRYLYRKYHSKGLEVVGISLDNDRERWLSAVQADSLDWKQLASLKGWECPVGGAYGIHWIPTLVLIGRDGRIVARRLDGDAMEVEIRKLLP